MTRIAKFHDTFLDTFQDTNGKARKFQDTFSYAKCQVPRHQGTRRTRTAQHTPHTQHTHTQAHKSLPIVVCYGSWFVLIFWVHYSSSSSLSAGRSRKESISYQRNESEYCSTWFIIPSTRIATLLTATMVQHTSKSWLHVAARDCSLPMIRFNLVLLK
jgi:hypothetical protein